MLPNSSQNLPDDSPTPQWMRNALHVEGTD